jgi:hypothetical protein
MTKALFMSSGNFNPRTSILFIFVFAIALIRVVINLNDPFSLLANFSPIGAMALFGGAYFDKRLKAFAFPLLMLFVSDFILHQTVFRNSGNGILYGGWYWVYSSFVLMVIAGRLILKRFSVGSYLLSVLVCVLIHWLVTDFGVWINSKIYAQNLSGFISCLANAIPFEWRFMAGTLVYGIILFGLFEWMQKRYSILLISKS